MRPFHKWLLWTTTALTGVTGGTYFWMERMLEPVDPWAVINHPLQPLVLKAHILFAPGMVLAVGMIATDHIWRHYRTRVRRARRTGLTAMWALAPMVVSGYLIQTITREGLLAVTAWAHIGSSVLFLLGIAAHQWVLARRTVASQAVARGEVEGAPLGV